MSQSDHSAQESQDHHPEDIFNEDPPIEDSTSSRLPAHNEDTLQPLIDLLSSTVAQYLTAVCNDAMSGRTRSRQTVALRSQVENLKSDLDLAKEAMSALAIPPPLGAAPSYPAVVSQTFFRPSTLQHPSSATTTRQQRPSIAPEAPQQRTSSNPTPLQKRHNSAPAAPQQHSSSAPAEPQQHPSSAPAAPQQRSSIAPEATLPRLSSTTAPLQKYHNSAPAAPSQLGHPHDDRYRRDVDRPVYDPYRHDDEDRLDRNDDARDRLREHDQRHGRSLLRQHNELDLREGHVYLQCSLRDKKPYSSELIRQALISTSTTSSPSINSITNDAYNIPEDETFDTGSAASSPSSTSMNAASAISSSSSINLAATNQSDTLSSSERTTPITNASHDDGPNDGTNGDCDDNPDRHDGPGNGPDNHPEPDDRSGDEPDDGPDNLPERGERPDERPEDEPNDVFDNDPEPNDGPDHYSEPDERPGADPDDGPGEGPDHDPDPDDGLDVGPDHDFNFDSSHDSWEPLSNFNDLGCIKRYWETLGNDKKRATADDNPSPPLKTGSPRGLPTREPKKHPTSVWGGSNVTTSDDITSGRAPSGTRPAHRAGLQRQCRNR